MGWSGLPDNPNHRRENSGIGNIQSNSLSAKVKLLKAEIVYLRL